MEGSIVEIDAELARKILVPGGPLSLMLKGYEFRPQQQEMLDTIIEAFNSNQISLIEAGTGIGKSMAYLIPAILWSAQNKERTLVSTNTISLQEQLLKKDIPLTSKVLGHPVKAVLVKGMSNYLCLRKLDEAKQDKRHLPDKESEEIEAIEQWSGNTKDGSLSDLPIAPSYAAWERVSAESDTCTQRKCPYYKDCHFFKARQEAEDAQLLVVNHAMLFADLAVKGDGDDASHPGLIPHYTRVILDEAHNIEGVATEFFADKVSNLPLLKWLSKLGGEKQGKLHLLSQKILLAYGSRMPSDSASIHDRLAIDLPGMRRDLLERMSEAFDCLEIFLHQESKGKNGGFDTKLRILQTHRQTPFWVNEVEPRIRSLTETIGRYAQTIRTLLKEIADLDKPKVKEQTESLCHDISAITNRFERSAEILKKMAAPTPAGDKVLWIETKTLRSMTKVTLVSADLDISQKLRKSLFERYPTSLLCSATLATNQSFSFIKDRLGIRNDALPGKTIVERIYQSPFDYVSQTLLFIPQDMPDPSSPRFLDASCEKILTAIEASAGNAFILFTSYGMMNACYDFIGGKLREKKYSLFKQGDANRSTLLEDYKKSSRAVLFGTDSFWEGVDVAGDALRLVIIVKLPFRVPSEPLIEARTEAITNQGGDPFYDYSVPNAIVKFKQGFGRLIRNKQDRGCILCLDPRIVNKDYGRLFLSSLPECQYVLPEGSDALGQRMKQFYQNR